MFSSFNCICYLNNELKVAKENWEYSTVYFFPGIPKATISTESKVYLGFTAQIRSKVSSNLPLSKYKWQKSVDGNAFEYIDNNERIPVYNGTGQLMNPSLLIRNTTFDDILYYRLLVWNRIGGCVSNTVYLNVTGSMFSQVI